MKRIISMLLAVILTLTSLPISLFADDSYTLTSEQIAELVSGENISEGVPADSNDTEGTVDDTISDTSETVAGDGAPSTPIDDVDAVPYDNSEQVDTVLSESPIVDTTIGETDYEETITEIHSAPTMLADFGAVSGTCGENVTWSLDTETGLLTISGEGTMKECTDQVFVPWHSNRLSITTVVIEDGVTSIGSYAFMGCSNLTSITIPNSITSIGDASFYSCSSLSSIALPDGVTNINDHAFSYCSSLTIITIPDSVTNIGSYAFSGCSSLTGVTIGNGVTSIGDYAFTGCSKLNSLTIGNNVKTIGQSAFMGCSELVHVTIPDSVTSVGNSAFTGCSSLNEVEFGSGLSVLEVPFGDCGNIEMLIFYGDSFTINGADNSLSMYHTFPPNATIYGYVGSAAHQYATEWGRNFVPIFHKPSFGSWEQYTAYEHIRYCTYDDFCLDTNDDNVADAYSYETAPHNFVETFHSGTCPEQGYTEHVCADCGDIYWDTETPPIYGHELQAELFDLGIYRCGYCNSEFDGPLLNCSITVRDAETADPIEGATIIFGNFGITTDATGALTFQTDNTEPHELRIIAENYPEFYIPEYNISKALNDDIYLTSALTDIYSVICNDVDVLNSKTLINVGAHKLKANFSVTGRAMADILRYELIQDGKIIASSTTGKFSVPNTRFVKGKDVYVRMHTNGLTNNVHERKLNINVVDYTFSFNADLKKLLPLSGGFNITTPDGVPLLSGMKFTSGLFLPDDHSVTVECTNDSILISYGIEYSSKPTLSMKEKFKKLLSSLTSSKSNTLSGDFAFVIILEFDEYGVTQAEGQILIKAKLEGEFGKTLFMVVPIYCEIGYSLESEVEIKNIGYDFANSEILIPVATYELGGSVTGRAGVGCNIASAGLYGRLGAKIGLSTAMEYGFDYFSINGEMGLYVKIDLLFWKDSYEYVIFNGEETWYGTSVQSINSALYSLENYEVSKREYLQDRSEWLGEMQTFSLDDTDKCLQVSSYDAIDPKIATAGNTTMMIFLDDDGRDATNYQHLFYSLYDKEADTWSEPKRVDSDDFSDAEYEIYSDGNKIYVVYTQIESDINNIEDGDYGFLSDVEVIVAEYDADSNEFVNHTNVSNNEQYDSSPSVTSVSDGLAVVWMSNPTNDVFMQNANNAVYVNTFTSGNWNEPLCISYNTALVSSIDIGMLNDELLIATISDLDCNYQTEEDKQIVIYDLSGDSVNIPSACNVIDNVRFVCIDNTDMLSWYGDQNIYTINNISDVPAAMFENPVSEFTSDYKLVDMGDGDYVVLFVKSYQTIDEQGDTVTGSNIYGTFRDNGVWGNPVSVTDMNDGRYIGGFAHIVSDDCIIIPYISTKAAFSDDAMSIQNNFMSTKVYAESDLQIEEIYYDIEDTVRVSVVVSNNSWEQCDELSINVESAYGHAPYSANIAVSIPSGATEVIEFEIEKADLWDGAEYCVSALPIGFTDSDLSNNEATLNVWHPDFTIDAALVYGNKAQNYEVKNKISYKIENIGNTSGDATLKVYKLIDEYSDKSDLDNQIVLTEQTISLEKYESMSDSLEITTDYLGTDETSRRIYLEVIPQSEELYLSDNEVCVTIDNSTRSNTEEITDANTSVLVPDISVTYLDYTKSSGETPTFVIQENDYAFDCVLDSNKNILDSSCYSYASGTFIIYSAYLDSLEIGEYRFAVRYTCGADTYDVYVCVKILGYASAEIFANDVTVKYDGEPVELGSDITYQTLSEGNISARYSSDGITWSDGLPTNAGVYTVELTVAQDNVNMYEEAKCQITLEITKASRAISVPTNIYELDGVKYFSDAKVTVGENDGKIQYGYSLTDDAATVTDWSDKGALPENNSDDECYYIFARVTGGTNYADAYSEGVAVNCENIVASGTCGENLTWELTSDGVLTISGEGEMTDYTISTSVPWYSYTSSIKTVIIENGTTSIGDLAFYFCSSLTSITIPDSVTNIGNRAFAGCSDLTSITFESAMTEIYDSESTISDTATIYGYPGSTAQTYAEKHRRTFVALDEPAKERTGNLNGDGVADKDDAIYLLYYTLFPEEYPITEDCDYNNDGSVDREDALYLLYHVIFGKEAYPLN